MENQSTIENSKLRRQIFLLKLLSCIAIIVLIFAVSRYSMGSAPLPFMQPSKYIGAISLEGAIMHDPYRIQVLRSIAKDSRVKALIVHINSPGGSAGASEEIYHQLRGIAKNKPVVAVLDTIAASGGYMAALGADHIVARGSTITGSIGVIWQGIEITKLAEKAGITPFIFKSSPIKAAPNLFESATEESSQAILEAVNDCYEQFVAMVSERRKLSIDEAKRVGDGRVYTGKKAHELKLIDAVGAEEEALDWLHSQNVAKDLSVGEISLIRRSVWEKFAGVQSMINNFLASYSAMLFM